MSERRKVKQANRVEDVISKIESSKYKVHEGSLAPSPVPQSPLKLNPECIEDRSGLLVRILRVHQADNPIRRSVELASTPPSAHKNGTTRFGALDFHRIEFSLRPRRYVSIGRNLLFVRHNARTYPFLISKLFHAARDWPFFAYPPDPFRRIVPPSSMF